MEGKTLRRETSGEWDDATLDVVLDLRRLLEEESFDERRWRLHCIRDYTENVFADETRHQVVKRKRTITIELED